jgi:TolB-like protein
MDAVRAQLERILSSRVLASSDQLKRLLRLSVERTIEGRSDLLKEYNLGQEVFQRPPDYDPKVDPIVRVQARRLRSKLEEYYVNEGAQDRLVIHIPKGAYIPEFRSRSNRDLRPLTSNIWIWLAAGAVAVVAVLLVLAYTMGKVRPDMNRSVAVLPLKTFVNDGAHSLLPDEVTEVLTTELAKSKQLRVLSRTTASKYRDPGETLPQIARSLGVRWIVEGGVGAQGTRIYVKLRAVDSLIDRKIWADVYDCDTNQLVQVNAGAAAKIEAAILAQLKQ